MSVKQCFFFFANVTTDATVLPSDGEALIYPAENTEKLIFSVPGTKLVLAKNTWHLPFSNSRTNLHVSSYTSKIEKPENLK